MSDFTLSNIPVTISATAPRSLALPNLIAEFTLDDMYVRIKRVRSFFTVQCAGFVPPCDSKLSYESRYEKQTVWQVGKFSSVDAAKICFRECVFEVLQNEMF